MREVGFVLSCYDRYDDLHAHLEILRFYPRPKKTIVVHMGAGSVDPALADEVIHFPSPGFKRGTVQSLLRGLLRANEMGLPAVVYRNADDWLLNHPWTARNFDMLLGGACKAAGYNWLSVGSDHDLALNELYLSVPHFAATAGQAERYFARESRLALCEHKAARWVKDTIDFRTEFYRLPGREAVPFVGLEPSDYAGFAATHAVPPDFFQRHARNNRFFNLDWLLLAHHDHRERWRDWVGVRHLVPYATALEGMPHFRRWVAAVRGEAVWNTVRPNDSRLKALGRSGEASRTARPSVPRRLVAAVRRPRPAFLPQEAV